MGRKKEDTRPIDDSSEDLDLDFNLEESNLGEALAQDPLLSEQVVEKDYTKLDAEIQGEMPPEIEEPLINKTVVDFNDHGDATEDGPDSVYDIGGRKYDSNGKPINNGPRSEPEPEPSPERGEVKNPGWSDMTSKQKNASAEYLAATCINAYEMLNNLGKRWCTFSEDKLQREALDGKFDFSILALEINLSEDGSETTTVGDFFDNINAQAEEVFKVSDEFKAEVKPLLVEIFKKKGWGLTTEQRLIAMIVEDAAPKVALAISIKSQFKQLIKMGMQMLNQNKVEAEAERIAAEQLREEPKAPPKPKEPKKDDIPLVEAEEVVFNDSTLKEPA